MTVETPSLRQAFIERIVCHHILASLAMARAGLVNVYEWCGSVREGRYFASSGNESWAAAWNRDGLVAVAQGVEGPIGAPIFGGVPPALALLGNDLSAWFTAKSQDAASSSLWLEEAGATLGPCTDRHEDRFAVLLTDRRDAFFGLGSGDVNLQEFFGLEEEDIWLAEETSTELMASTELVLDESKHAKLLGSPLGHEQYVKARRMLEQLGLSFAL